MSNPNVTTIVVNWKLKERTAQCLHSLEQSEYPCHILVVDNGSGDGSIEYIQERFPAVETLALPANLGFGRACNVAIRRAMQQTDCEFIFLLNNDAVIHPLALGRLVEMAQKNPQAGVLGPKIYYQDQSDGSSSYRIWYAGARQRWGILAAADTGRGQVDHGQFDQTRQVDYVFGAAMLIRRSMLERIGLFDESFFLYLEDLDVCIRARQAGFSLLFVPQARAWHVGFASTSQNPALRRYHYIRSTVLFLRKHVSPVFILPALVFWMSVLLRMIVADLLRGDLHLVITCWLALSGVLFPSSAGIKSYDWIGSYDADNHSD